MRSLGLLVFAAVCAAYVWGAWFSPGSLPDELRPSAPGPALTYDQVYERYDGLLFDDPTGALEWVDELLCQTDGGGARASDLLGMRLEALRRGAHGPERWTGRLLRWRWERVLKRQSLVLLAALVLAPLSLVVCVTEAIREWREIRRRVASYGDRPLRRGELAP